MAERAPQPPEMVQEDPFLAALDAAEWDDEPLTDEDIAAMREGETAIRWGEYVAGLKLLRRTPDLDGPAAVGCR